MDKSSISKRRKCQTVELSPLEKSLINLLQHGLPVCERPFAQIAEEVSSTEEEVIACLNNLRSEEVLTRFGPMFDAASLGGAFTLAALSVPEEDFDFVTEQVNSFDQIAHNYRRDHDYNMWFVIATESAEEIEQVVQAIENKTGLKVLNVPKLKEFYVCLYLPV
ncbi:Lrp/AsnC family transcriptional regulator [Candidatus Colwellia aromaticivorans]|uniref:Lrp/AsnC family transcriptional regulator n=1 Tax=Candidatus Colwellia aromaticivorans TaxID=2267621 RepID=UPI000DF1955D|nr:Lrp/AsnC family transcriptional regulator [Candidatus Colwellia aromaticivorans]